DYFTTQNLDPEKTYSLLKQNGWLQFFLTSAHLLVVATIVGKEVQDGIEKWVGYVIPAFAVLLCVLSYKSLTEIDAPDALRYLFYPDFSKLKLTSIGYALGHVCFTLSIGFGAMVTFGSYLKEYVYVPMTGFKVSVLDAVLSIFGGLLVVPLIINTSSAAVPGPDMLFVALPKFLVHIHKGNIYGFLFFLCLYLSALGGSIGLLETVVANLKDTYGIERSRSAWRVGAICLVMAMIPVFANKIITGSAGVDSIIIKNMDLILVNWILPIVALVISQYAIRIMDSTKVYQEFEDENKPMSKQMYRHYLFVLKWVIPVVVFAAIALQIADLFKS
ncbi:sodium-dependent transporter, partial [bacterium]|nr:sodium-dependent transporter [bacterium]